MSGVGAETSSVAQVRQEEEEMSSYSARDLAEDWEFKILRSTTAVFRDPVRLRAVLEEEARAGWSLIEKLDNGRVRLKRPASARGTDFALGFDPYRSYVGVMPARFVLTLVFSILGGVGLILAIVFTIVFSVFHSGR
jgi:hypothetical protein